MAALIVVVIAGGCAMLGERRDPLRSPEAQADAVPTSVGQAPSPLQSVGGLPSSHPPPPPGIEPPQWVGQRHGHTSTFAVDVDTASYRIARRWVEDRGRLPPRELVRIEDFVNAAPAGDPLPDDDDLALHLELAPHPQAPGHDLLRLALTGRSLRGERPPLNLVLLIDGSGSMRDHDRLPLLQRGLSRFVGLLGPQDRIAIVRYARFVDVVQAPVAGDRHQELRQSLQRLRAGGSTDGAAGLRVAYELAAEMRHRPGIHRVLLATDGSFNQGITDHERLGRLVRERADAGIALSVLGVGDDTDDARLEAISNLGDGAYHHLADQADLERVLRGQVDGTLAIVAEDVKVQLFFHPGAIARWRLVGYDNRRLAAAAFADDRRDAGDIGARERVVAFYELEYRSGLATGSTANPFLAQAQAEDWTAEDPLLRVRVRHQPAGGGPSRLREVDLHLADRRELTSAGFRWSWAAARLALGLRRDPYARIDDPATIASDLASAHAELGSDPERARFLAFAQRVARRGGQGERGNPFVDGASPSPWAFGGPDLDEPPADRRPPELDWIAGANAGFPQRVSLHFGVTVNVFGYFNGRRGLASMRRINGPTAVVEPGVGGLKLGCGWAFGSHHFLGYSFVRPTVSYFRFWDEVADYHSGDQYLGFDTHFNFTYLAFNAGVYRALGDEEEDTLVSIGAGLQF